jgi:hypothetical protein
MIAPSRLLLSVCIALFASTSAASGFQAQRIAHPAAVTLDGKLDEALWRQGAWREGFFEIAPAELIAAKQRTEVSLAYDGKHLYVGVRAWDPDPAALRAPFARRDKLSTDQDTITILLDPSGGGKAAQMISFNPRGAVSDGNFSDAGGDDLAPDFDVSVASARFDGGWSAELRIPFTSVAYAHAQTTPWHLLVIRNMTREQRTRMASSAIPKSSNCSLCFAEPIHGLRELPTGIDWSITPQLAVRASREQIAGKQRSSARETVPSLDAKLRLDSASVIDLTINPDFSQVELDAPQLSANTRFGLFSQEKRPFFLEGNDILQTPLRAIHTRTISNPSWGLRYTRRDQHRDLVVLSAHDDGGGLVQLPNAYYTGFAAQSSGSQATFARANFKLGALSLGVLGTDRSIDGDRGYNRVAGSDFQWQRNDAERLSGQLLLSSTTAHPDANGELAASARVSGHAARLEWNRVEPGWSANVVMEDVGDGFRADNGFFSQVGYRDVNFLLSKKQGKTGMLNELNLYVFGDRKHDSAGDLIVQDTSIGAWMSGPFDSELEFHVRPHSRARTEQHGQVFETRRYGGRIGATPGPMLARIGLEGEFGEQIDVLGARVGKGGTWKLSARVRLSDRIELEPAYSSAWTNGDTGGRWFSEHAARLNGIVHLGPRDTLRLILQQTRSRRDPAMYRQPVAARSDAATASLVYGHTASLGTAAYAGVIVSRGDTPGYAPLRRVTELFVKLSWQI